MLGFRPFPLGPAHFGFKFTDDRLSDFWVRIEHHESLHAHDAVGVFIKGVEDGYQPTP